MKNVTHNDWQIYGLFANADQEFCHCREDCERCGGSAIDSVPIAATRKLISQSRTIRRLRVLVDGWKQRAVETFVEYCHELLKITPEQATAKERARIVAAIRLWFDDDDGHDVRNFATAIERGEL